MDFPIQTLLPKEYPESLREIPNIPEKLFVRGTPIDTSQRMIAVVGARRYSMYGKKACEKIIAELAPYPVTIVSGLAIGIDAVAHEAALQAGLVTVAVVGSGLNDSILYPSINRNLAKQILQQGGTLISELDPDTRAAKHTFPSRNRIMAGLSEVVIAIECTLRSGTCITARLAADYNKEVAAVPHPIFSETGVGANNLIQQGAHLVGSGEDVVKLLNLDITERKVRDTSTLTDKEQAVYEILSEPKTKTAIAEEVGMPTQVLQVALAGLEMKGLVIEMLGLVQRQ